MALPGAARVEQAGLERMLLRVSVKARRALFAGFSAIIALGCKTPSKRAPAGATASASAAPSPTAKPHFLRWARGELPLEQFLQREVERAEAEGVQVMVYVGATWCEPCRYFHQAVEHGEVDRELAGLRFLEFDADRDGAELASAGYGSKYIPLFAIPYPDGRASGRMIEGSIKGPSAVREDLLPRLRKLLSGDAGQP